MKPTDQAAFNAEWQELRERYGLETYTLIYIMEEGDALSFALNLVTTEEPKGLSRARICVEMIGQGLSAFVTTLSQHSGLNLQAASAALKEMVEQSKIEMVNQAMRRRRQMQAVSQGPIN